MNIAGNYYDKYASRNPLVRWMMRRFLEAFDRLAESSGQSDAHEIGCGEGHLVLRLARKGWRVRGTDMDVAIVADAASRAREAGADVTLSCRGIDELNHDEDARPLIICCEVLEHVAEPERAVDKLAELSCPWLLASVPREPLWRVLNVARGRYLADLGNTPGHINHWTSAGFLKLLERRFTIVAVAHPIPWTMALARRKTP